MHLESLYNSMPSRVKEDVGFPQIYNQLTPGQEIFLIQISPQYQLKKMERLDCVTQDVEVIVEDLKETYEAAKNVMTNLQRIIEE